jgi:hypothetical protein
VLGGVDAIKCSSLGAEAGNPLMPQQMDHLHKELLYVIVIVILFTFHKSNVGYNPVDIDIVPYYTNTCHYIQC